MSLDLTLTDLQSTPFRYAVFESVFPRAVHESLLQWLENCEFWKLAKTEFYEQYEFSVDHVALPREVRFLVGDAFKSALRVQMEELFDTSLSSRVSVLAHKLEPGQHIGIHNDMICGGESHRFTVQLNCDLCDFSGGYFVLFNSGDAQDVHRMLKPIPNSALAFAISRKSHHAVTTQHRGTRFTLVFSFFSSNRSVV